MVDIIDVSPKGKEKATSSQQTEIHLGILTPFYGGQGYVNYFICLMNTIKVLEKEGVKVTFIPMSGDSLVTRARNNLIAKGMNDPTITHFMFIDADISWSPVEVIKLLNHNKDISGGIYPLKNYKWDHLNDYTNLIEKNKNKIHANIPFTDFVAQNLMKYNLNYRYEEFKIENNLVEVRHIATGFMMIKRGAIEAMISAHPEWSFNDDMGAITPDEDRFAYTLFDCITKDGHYLSEDWVFCERFIEMGGQIFADVTINLTHTGTHNFKGRFLSSLNIKI